MKNVKAVVMNVVLVLVSVLGFVFMSQAYMTALGSTGVGYEFVDMKVSGMGSNFSLVKASVFINIIVLSLVAVVAIVNLLVNFNVIKNDKLAKVLNLVNVVLTVLFVVSAVLALVGMNGIVADSMGFGKLGWAVIANLVLAVVGAIVAVANLVLNRKK